MSKELISKLRHLVSLNEPRHGGPYQGAAATACVEAMREAADLLEKSLPIVSYDSHRYAVASANYSRPYLLGAYSTLEKAKLAQGGKPETWEIFVKLDEAQL